MIVPSIQLEEMENVRCLRTLWNWTESDLKYDSGALNTKQVLPFFLSESISTIAQVISFPLFDPVHLFKVYNYLNFITRSFDPIFQLLVGTLDRLWETEGWLGMMGQSWLRETEGWLGVMWLSWLYLPCYSQQLTNSVAWDPLS